MPTSKRIIYSEEAEDYCIAEVSTKKNLNLLDLTGKNAFLLGISTDTVGAKHHGAGQEISKHLYEDFPDIDGILYESRLSKGSCAVVYDRAITHKLRAERVMRLSDTYRIDTALAAIGFSYVVED